MFLTICGRKKDASYLGPGMTTIIYFGELIFALAVAIALLATSTFKPSTTGILFCCGILAWTLSEYIIHRFVLHAILYYRVPGFPIGFGHKTKARQLLEQATKLAPTGLDAWYFYGDFLYEQNEYSKAAEVFHHALGIPPHPDRPVWDKNRRLVIEERLASIAAKQ